MIYNSSSIFPYNLYWGYVDGNIITDVKRFMKPTPVGLRIHFDARIEHPRVGFGSATQELVVVAKSVRIVRLILRIVRFILRIFRFFVRIFVFLSGNDVHEDGRIGWRDDWHPIFYYKKNNCRISLVYINLSFALTKSVLNWTQVCQLHWKTQLNERGNVSAFCKYF